MALGSASGVIHQQPVDAKALYVEYGGLPAAGRKIIELIGALNSSGG